MIILPASLTISSAVFIALFCFILLLLPLLFFLLFVSAVSNPKTRLWGIVIPACFITVYLVPLVLFFGNFFEDVHHRKEAGTTLYCDRMSSLFSEGKGIDEVLDILDKECDCGTFTRGKPFRFMWLGCGILLYLATFLLIFKPGYREKHAGDCIFLFLLSHAVMLTGVYQIESSRSFKKSIYYSPPHIFKDWHHDIDQEIRQRNKSEVLLVLKKIREDHFGEAFFETLADELLKTRQSEEDTNGADDIDRDDKQEPEAIES